jgi:hypothetical protein
MIPERLLGEFLSSGEITILELLCLIGMCLDIIYPREARFSLDEIELDTIGFV